MAAEIPVEVHHERHSMTVTARLPGVRVQDLRIAFSRDHLTIEAESSSGPCACELPLAAPVDERRASIRFADGILALYLPTLGT